MRHHFCVLVGFYRIESMKRRTLVARGQVGLSKYHLRSIFVFHAFFDSGLNGCNGILRTIIAEKILTIGDKRVAGR